MAAPTLEELRQRKKAAEDELERQTLEAEVKELEKRTKKPSLIVGVARVYVRGAKAGLNLLGQAVDELNKPPAKGKKGKSK